LSFFSLLPSSVRSSMTMSETFSPLRRGNRVAAVASPSCQRFSRSGRSSLKRLPDRATRVRFRTVVPLVSGLRPRRQTPSPTRKPPASARVTSWSNQSESSASLLLADGSLMRTESAPLPSRRRRDGR
jgi:hypothetical protein